MTKERLIQQLLVAERIGLIAKVIRIHNGRTIQEVEIRFLQDTDVTKIQQLQKHIQENYMFQTQRCSELYPNSKPMEFLIVRFGTAR